MKQILRVENPRNLRQVKSNGVCLVCNLDKSEGVIRNSAQNMRKGALISQLSVEKFWKACLVFPISKKRSWRLGEYNDVLRF